MVDVFVSYARDDARRVEPLVSLLKANGCDVWWDRDIAPGTQFEAQIEAALAAAQCVLIALTAHAARSDWVLAEAAVAQQHNKVIPVLLDDVPVPLSLRALQVADLRHWPGASDAEVQKLLQVISVRGQAADQRFVGRADAMDTLHRELNAACDGKGTLVMIAGEPGIGKTSCAEEFSRIAEDQGALVLWGRCYEQPGAPAYWPWLQILREFAAANSDDELRVLLAGSADAIATLVPDIGARIGVAPMAMTDSDHGDQRFHLFDAIIRVIARTTANVPLVLVLDDLHWADASSLALLEYLSKELRRLRCVIVCAYRDVEVTRKSPLLATLGELSRASRVERLRLAGLSIDETGELTTALSGTRIPQSIVASIHQQTDGNPLFVREVARVLAEERSRATGDVIAIEVPDGIREAIGRRLDRLSDRCNGLLAIASAIGRDFDLKIVAATAESSLDSCIAELEDASRAGIIRREGAGTAYRFAHAVIRETLYEEMATLERLQLHRRIAVSLESAFRGNLDPVLSQLVHHYAESSPLGDIDLAVDFALRTAARDQAMFAYEEACRHYDAALQILHANGCDDDPRASRAYAEKGHLQMKMAHIGAAVATIMTGIALSRRLQDWTLFAREVMLLVRLTSYGPQQHAASLVEEALRMLPEHQIAERAILLAHLAFAQRSTGDMSKVVQTGSDSITLARGTEDPYLIADALHMVALGLRGDARTLAMRLEYGREMAELVTGVTDKEEVCECLYFFLLDLIDAGEINEFALLLDRYGTRASASHLVRHEYQAALLRAQLFLLRGDWHEAEERIEHAFERGQQIFGQDQFMAAEGVYGAQMFMLNRELGRLRTMTPIIKRMIEDDSTHMWAPGLMAMCCEIGLIDHARAAFDRIAANEFTDIPLDDMWLTCMVFCVEACHRLGDAGRAASLYELLLPYADQAANQPAAVCYGAVSTYLGMLAHIMGNDEHARSHLRTGIEKSRAMSAWPALARAQAKLAQLLLASDIEVERHEGRHLIGEAEQLATRFKMAGLVAEISALLNDDVNLLPDGITSREAEVLKLLAMGRSNKDISKVLDISLSTVATHVRSILTKAGCANRTEAAAYAIRQNLN